MPPPGVDPQLWMAVVHGFSQLFRAARNFERIDVPGGSLALTGLPVPDLNCGVVLVNDDPAATVAGLASELQHRNLPGILLVPDAVGESAGRAAEACGMVVAARMPLMTRGPAQPPARSQFRVRRATTAAELAVANGIIAAAFELPPDAVAAAFRPTLLAAGDAAVELVCDGELPVGCLQVTACGRLLGIWSMATPPEHRRRGIARAGLEHVVAKLPAVADARAFLIATEAGRPLYEAVGFQNAAWCTAWVHRGPGPDRA